MHSIKKTLPLALVIALCGVVIMALWWSWQQAMRWTPERLAQTPLHYQLLWDDTVIGAQNQHLEQLPDGSWQWHVSHQIRASVRDMPINETVSETLVFDGKAPFRLRFAEIQRNDAIYTIHNDKRFVVSRGDAVLIEHDPMLYHLNDVLAPMQLIANGPHVGQRWQTKQFDTQQFRLLISQVEVIAEVEDAGNDLWQLALTSADATYQSTLFVRDDGVLFKQKNGAIELRLSDKKVELPIASADLYQLQTIPTNRALGDSKSISRLSLRWPAHIHLPLQTRDDQLVTPGFVQTQLTLSPRANEDEIAHALESESRYSSDDSSFVQRAQALTTGLNTPEQKARALLVFVSEHLEQSTEVREQTALTVMRHKKGDCTEFSQLFVALARANGLPAREVSGLVYLGDQQQRFGGHTWADVLIDGRWQSVDPMWNLFGVTATHLRMGEGEQGAVATLTPTNGLRFDVDAVLYKQ